MNIVFGFGQKDVVLLKLKKQINPIKIYGFPFFSLSIPDKQEKVIKLK